MPLQTLGRVFLAVVIGLSFFGAVPSPSLAGPSAAEMRGSAMSAVGAARQDRLLVRATLESRMTDKKVLNRMRVKIDELSGKKLRLAAELCERVRHHEGTPAADLAFSLVTALIVLT